MLQAEFSANAEKAAHSENENAVIQGNCNWHSACNVQAWHLRANERDLKNRKRFGWTDDDATADWPHAAGAYRRIESANKGRRGERHTRLERSKPGRPGCHSLPGSMSNRRHLPRSLFPLYQQLDHQRAVQRSIKFAEHQPRLRKVNLECGGKRSASRFGFADRQKC
ncbi:MAG: hypothetical protein QOF62_2285 [Pyrinomonadaceae bacterium]|nr:hypothetical protein [Pyrinomonadaceae bacterium]